MSVIGQLVSYETEHYDRRFLDCWRRQAVVFLEKQGAPVESLFCDVLASTDQILDDQIIHRRPKYAFPTPALNNEGLSLIGWEQQIRQYDTFAHARTDISSHMAATPFVIVMGSVFYFPHCPEFRTSHVNHSVVLVSGAPTGQCDIVDDDPASVLAAYRYDEDMVSDFFDNNAVRQIRYFRFLRSVEPAVLTRGAIERCRAHIGALQDSHRLLKEIGDIAANPYEAVALRATKLHEAFSLLSGSRALFARFAERRMHDKLTADRYRRVADEAYIVKNAMIKAQVTGRLNIDSLAARCAAILQLECAAMTSLRHTLEHA